MAGNSFGQLFRITTFGESHGGAVGVVVDGCPPGIEITEEEIQVALDRRRPGQSKITTPRKEADKIKILSGYFEGKTTGTPILLIAYNQDVKSEDYTELMKAYRPSHADFTYEAKYGFRDWRGGGGGSGGARRRRRDSAEISEREAWHRDIELRRTGGRYQGRCRYGRRADDRHRRQHRALPRPESRTRDDRAHRLGEA